jgi:hypothetical protein
MFWEIFKLNILFIYFFVTDFIKYGHEYYCFLNIFGYSSMKLKCIVIQVYLIFILY